MREPFYEGNLSEGLEPVPGVLLSSVRSGGCSKPDFSMVSVSFGGDVIEFVIDSRIGEMMVESFGPEVTYEGETGAP